MSVYGQGRGYSQIIFTLKKVALSFQTGVAVFCIISIQDNIERLFFVTTSVKDFTNKALFVVEYRILLNRSQMSFTFVVILETKKKVIHKLYRNIYFKEFYILYVMCRRQVGIILVEKIFCYLQAVVWRTHNFLFS